ncbi:MAG: PAS domain-containing protein [Planctomycetota bacterium]
MTDSLTSPAPSPTFDLADVISPREMAAGQTQPADSASRRQAALVALGRRSRAHSETADRLRDAASLVAEVLGLGLIAVAEVVDRGTNLLLHLSSLGEEHGNLPATQKMAFDPLRSMVAFAMGAAEPIAAPRLSDETRFADRYLLSLGVESGLAVPLCLETEQFGAIAVLSRGRRAFAAEDVMFAESMGQLLTATLAHEKAERQLRQQRAMNESMLNAVDTMVFLLDIEGNLVDMNKAAREATRFSVGDVAGRSAAGLFAAPRESGLLESLIRSASEGQSVSQRPGHLMTKGGARRYVVWSARPIDDGTECVNMLLLTAADQPPPPEPSDALARPRRNATARPRPAETSPASTTPADASATMPPDTAVETPPAAAVPYLEADHPFEPKPAPRGIELRRSPRRSFHYRQRIAAVYRGMLPRLKDFFEVDCEDISAGGIAFSMPQKPDFRDLVVALGQEPNLSHFSATVVRVVERETAGTASYLVACRFMGRIIL